MEELIYMQLQTDEEEELADDDLELCAMAAMVIYVGAEESRLLRA